LFLHIILGSDFLDYAYVVVAVLWCKEKLSSKGWPPLFLYARGKFCWCSYF